MENRFLDQARADRQALSRLRTFYSQQVKGRRCIIIGSAPEPTFPQFGDDYIFCVNASAFSLATAAGRIPDATFLNSRIFELGTPYSDASLAALSGRPIGKIIVNGTTTDRAVSALHSHKVQFAEVRLLDKYQKRLVLGDVLGSSAFGIYRHDSNISNGFFMSAFALWSGANQVIMSGFSFNDAHAYSMDKKLFARAHVREDMLFLELARQSRLPIEITGKPLA